MNVKDPSGEVSGSNEERVIGHWRKSYAYYKVTEHSAKLCYTVWKKNKTCKH